MAYWVQLINKPKGRFFWFVYAKGIPKEPSLWFAPAVADPLLQFFFAEINFLYIFASYSPY